MTYNGLIIVDKIEGIGSTDCVNIVKKKLNMKKVGHSGTLDFLATGVLVVCLGKATKIIEYLQRQKKTYVAGIQFGIETDTLDIEGKIINTTNKKVNFEEFENSLMPFTGKINQIPPMYSALKSKGTRLYDLARAGIEIERKPRPVEIYSLKILDFNFDNQQATIETTVSAGTYIRSLVDDLGKSMGNYAHMDYLRRTESCGFDISEAIDITTMEKEDILNKIIPMEKGLSNYTKFVVSEAQKLKLLNGMTVQVDADFLENDIIVFDNLGEIIGIGNLFETMKGKMLKLTKHLYINENN